MGRKRLVFVDKDALLVEIWRIEQEIITRCQAAIEASERAWGTSDRDERERLWREGNAASRELRIFNAEGIQHDVQRFVGRPLGTTERIRTCEALREMEADGLVFIVGIRGTTIGTTEAGAARAAELIELQAKERTRSSELDAGLGEV